MFSSKICNIKKINKIGEIRWNVEGIDRGNIYIFQREEKKLFHFGENIPIEKVKLNVFKVFPDIELNDLLYSKGSSDSE